MLSQADLAVEARLLLAQPPAEFSDAALDLVLGLRDVEGPRLTLLGLDEPDLLGHDALQRVDLGLTGRARGVVGDRRGFCRLLGLALLVKQYRRAPGRAAGSDLPDPGLPSRPAGSTRLRGLFLSGGPFDGSRISWVDGVCARPPLYALPPPSRGRPILGRSNRCQHFLVDLHAFFKVVVRELLEQARELVVEYGHRRALLAGYVAVRVHGIDPGHGGVLYDGGAGVCVLGRRQLDLLDVQRTRRDCRREQVEQLPAEHGPALERVEVLLGHARARVLHDEDLRLPRGLLPGEHQVGHGVPQRVRGGLEGDLHYGAVVGPQRARRRRRRGDGTGDRRLEPGERRVERGQLGVRGAELFRQRVPQQVDDVVRLAGHRVGAGQYLHHVVELCGVRAREELHHALCGLHVHARRFRRVLPSVVERHLIGRALRRVGVVPPDQRVDFGEVQEVGKLRHARHLR